MNDKKQLTNLPGVSPIKEILVLHHSHLDLGYTHSQPVIKSLQAEYIAQALDLLDQTEDLPELNRPKWTCEVTEPVMWWLADASGADVKRFERFLHEGRMGISGLAFNGTPLSNIATLSEQLKNKRILEERFGIPIRTANIHDVNGVPWPMVDILLDEEIELLTMAVNLHFGHPVDARPGVFRWEGPSGRTIHTMNGAHYTMFDQHLYSWQDSVDRMAEGWAAYRAHLEQIGYPYDFCYLTTTCSPQLWDNAPPNPFVAELIGKWNQNSDRPPIRYVTPDDMLERIKELPDDLTPVRRGDWTDYWIFGVGARAHEAKLYRQSRRFLHAAESMNALAARCSSAIGARHRQEARDSIAVYEEHTCSHYNTDPANEFARTIDGMKNYHAYQARETAFLAMIEELDDLAGNEACARRMQSVAFYNPSGVEQEVYLKIPPAWREDGRFFRGNRFQPENVLNGDGVDGELCGPVTVEPYSWKRAAMESLKPATASADLRHTVGGGGNTHTIETPWYRLTFHTVDGRVGSLYDIQHDWEVLAGGEDGFFDFVRERPDDSADGTRKAFFKRDLEREKFDLSNWCDWAAIRQRATAAVKSEIKESPGEIHISTRFEAPGVRDLRRTIILRANSPLIGIEVSMEKLADANPEAIYFTTGLRMDAGWRCHFDTAATPTELDADQLPGSCRNWLCVDNYLSIHQDGKGVALFCPDAPMAMPGDFQFGPPLDAIPRQDNPLLIAWPMNNYWETNFSLVQPGYTSFRYELLCHGSYDAVELAAHADAINNPVLHTPSPAPPCETTTLLRCDCDAVRIVDICKDNFSDALILRLFNVSQQTVNASLELNFQVVSIKRCSAQGRPLDDENRLKGANPIVIEMKPLELLNLLVQRLE